MNGNAKPEYNLTELTKSDPYANWFGKSTIVSPVSREMMNPVSSVQVNQMQPTPQRDDVGGNAVPARNIGYLSALMSGIAGYNDSTYSNAASQAETNAALARQQSYQTGVAGSRAANDTRYQGQRLMGSQQAAYGASGVNANSGSALAVQSGTALRAERDAQAIMKNTAIKQWGLDNEAAEYDAQATNYRNAAKAQKRSALLNTGLQIAKIYWGVGG